MKRISVFIAFCLVSALCTAQNGSGSGSGKVSVTQSETVRAAFEQHLQANGDRKIPGYRIRIYFDSSQDARSVSDEIAVRFSEMYPEIPVYKSYTSPFFKVTVGDFRSREDALLFSKELSGRFPSTFLVQEAINYPAL